MEEGTQQLTVLVVDDEPAILRFAARVLERSGHAAICAENGPSALSIFESQRNELDLVLLDLTMPAMSGNLVLDRIREISATIPVLLSSGYPAADELERHSRHGPVGFLQKPYRAQALLESVLALVRLNVP